MSSLEVTIDGQTIEPPDGWTFAWLDEAHGVAQLSRDGAGTVLLVEGNGADWVVTMRGRRVPAIVRTWRERTLAEAEGATRASGGPLNIMASLPGLVVSVDVAEGAEVAAGQSLLTIEAMKMQNEVRAPRAGRVATVAVVVGQTVTKGVLLVRFD